MSFSQISTLAARVLNYLFRCAERASQRRVLCELDEHVLRDIGLTRHDALVEAARPFWSGADQVRFVALSENDSARRGRASGRRNRPFLSAGTIIGKRRDGKYSCS
jgi:uncharacterized protein YjiS (DUF1127 family)